MSLRAIETPANRVIMLFAARVWTLKNHGFSVDRPIRRPIPAPIRVHFVQLSHRFFGRRADAISIRVAIGVGASSA